MNNLESAYRSATEQAVREWTQRNHPDDFNERAEDADGNEVNVHIYHHETFPMGGQAFTVDVRPEKGSPELLERSRVSLVNGQALRT